MLLTVSHSGCCQPLCCRLTIELPACCVCAGAALCRGHTWSAGLSKSVSCKPCPPGFVVAAAKNSNPAERDSIKKCSEWLLEVAAAAALALPAGFETTAVPLLQCQSSASSRAVLLLLLRTHRELHDTGGITEDAPQTLWINQCLHLSCSCCCVVTVESRSWSNGQA